MLRGRGHSRAWLGAGALLAGVAALSCGGEAVRDVVGSAPAADGAQASDAGAVTAAAAAQKQLICHYDKTLDSYSTLSVTSGGANAHVGKHEGDYAGMCAVCPCFTPADFEATATYCPTNPTYGCIPPPPDEPSWLGLYCDSGSGGGGSGGIATPLAYFGVSSATSPPECVTVTYYPVPDAGTSSVAVDPQQYEACRTLITNNIYCQ